MSALQPVLAALDAASEALPASRATHRAFLGAYRRTTAAMAAAIETGVFEDPDWVAAWDVAASEVYLAALEADLQARPTVPLPWRSAFGAAPSLPPLRHLILGMNAHINYDVPQALLAVIPDDDFADPDLIARRHRDHMRIDRVVTNLVPAEDRELATTSARVLADRLLRPLNRWSARRCLTEARRKVWHNTLELQRSRAAGPEVFARRLRELEELSAARIDDLLAPGQVIIRLAVVGFGVVLPPVPGPVPLGPAGGSAAAAGR